MFEVGKKYKSTETGLIYECVGQYNDHRWMVRLGADQAGSIWDGRNHYSEMKEYTPPVIVERYVNIYCPNHEGTISYWPTKQAAELIVHKNKIGVAKYTYTDGKITSITICD